MGAGAGDEQVEWVDDLDAVIEVVPRARVRSENLRHRSVAVIVTTTDGRLLVHRRSDTKDLLPGWWDLCAGGVVGVGESYEGAARRELAEEVGVTEVHLEPLGVGRHDDAHTREICHVYRAVHDGPFVCVDGEVAETRLVTTEEFSALAAEQPFLPGSLRMVLPHVEGFALEATPRSPGDRSPFVT